MRNETWWGIALWLVWLNGALAITAIGASLGSRVPVERMARHFSGTKLRVSRYCWRFS